MAILDGGDGDTMIGRDYEIILAATINQSGNTGALGGTSRNKQQQKSAMVPASKIGPIGITYDPELASLFNQEG